MKTRTNKFRGVRLLSLLTRVIKETFKLIFYILVGIMYIILKIYVEFEKTFLKIWGLLPRWFRRLAIILMIFNIFALNNKEPQLIEKLITNTKEVYVVQESYIESCNYGSYECAIYNEAIKQGMNEEQSKIAIAISKHETSNYTSTLFKNSNNIGGLYDSNNNKFFKYDSLDSGIKSFIRNLKKGYFDKGFNKIDEIQKKYAPINATNDPNGLNKHWVNGVTYFYNELA